MSRLSTLLAVAALGTLAGAARPDDPLPDGARLRLGPTKFRVPYTGRMLALTPDGKAVVTFRQPDALRFLAVETGKELKTVSLPTDAQRGGWYSLDRTTDGRRLVATQYNAVYVLDGETGKVVFKVDVKETDKRLGGLGGSLEGMIGASADGSRVAVGTRYPRNNDGASAVVLDAATGQVVATVKPGQSNYVRTVLSGDGKRLATFGQYYERKPNDEPWGQIVQVWDVATGAEACRIKTGAPHQVQAAAFSPDGRTLVTAAPGGPVQAWDAATGKFVRQYVGRSGLGQGLFFSPDGHRLAAAGTDGSVQVWETATGKRLGLGAAMVHNVADVAFSSGGPAVALGAFYQSLQVWTVPGKVLTPQDGHLGPVTALQFTPDGKHLVTAAQDQRAIRWDAATGAELGHLAKPTPTIPGRSSPSWYFYHAAFTPDCKTAAVPHGSSGISVIDLETGTENFTLPFPGGRSSSDARVSLSADGRVVAGSCRSYDNRGKNATVACAWDLETGQPLAEFRAEQDEAGGYLDNAAVTVTPDGARMAVSVVRRDRNTGQPSLELTAFDLATGRPTAKGTYPTQHYSPLLAAAGDGRSVLVPGYGGKVGVWDLPSGKMARTLDVPANAGGQVLRFSPDGRLAAVALGGGATRPTIRLVPALGRPTANQPGFRLQVLEWATGTPRFEWPAAGMVAAAAFSPDGSTLAVGWTDTSVLFFDVTGAAGPRPWEKSPTDPAKLWAKVATGGGEDGWAAMRELIARPDAAVPLLKEKIKPAPAKSRPTADELAKLIRQLDAPAFADREAAGKALRELGPLAGPAVRQALKDTTSTEVRQRLEKIAENLDKPAGVNVAEVRAVEVLERIGTGPAKEYLTVLTDGEPTAPLTRDAAAALKRLSAKR